MLTVAALAADAAYAIATLRPQNKCLNDWQTFLLEFASFLYIFFLLYTHYTFFYYLITLHNIH